MNSSTSKTKILPDEKTLLSCCFKENTKILTDKGYKLIQDLRKGDLVKTLNHGFIPIDMIGKKEIYHPASNERIILQLYKCCQDNYPELFEDLIITGNHNILVNDFTSDEQRRKSINLNGNKYITNKKYKLPVYLDNKATFYEIQGSYTIYNLTLENDDYHFTYGIYTNGLLVESCSKSYLQKIPDMIFI
jgi:hypothetical protein